MTLINCNRWPLVLRFVKGAIHADIALPVILHALLTALLVYLDVSSRIRVELPPQIVGTLVQSELWMIIC